MTNPQCPHGHTYGTCLMCYHDLVAEQQSEIERLHAERQRMIDGQKWLFHCKEPGTYSVTARIGPDGLIGLRFDEPKGGT